MERTRVRDIMSSPVIAVAPDTTVPTAMELMRKHRIRHLPVIEAGRLVGIISHGDLRQASITAAINADSYELHFMLSRLPVGKVMTSPVFTIAPDVFIVQAAELMTEHKIAGLPVVEKDGSVVGIVTESDLLKLLVQKLHEAEARAEAGVP